MKEKKISNIQAKKAYGVTTKHGRMSSGELRFRLTPLDENGYIRTVAGDKGGWQCAHFHTSLLETYIVERGWMALAEKDSDQLNIKFCHTNDIITTRPLIPHNVFLSCHAVIHTVKHGGHVLKDWQGDPELTKQTQLISEGELMAIESNQGSNQATSEKRFEAYIALYNNLDNLIWRIPGFLVAGASILIGFFATVYSKGQISDIPHIVVFGIFLFIGLLFFLSYYSMTRIREHHTLAGKWLKEMEDHGYFHERELTLQRTWPPSSTLVFRYIYAILAVIFWLLAFLSLFRFQYLIQLMKLH